MLFQTPGDQGIHQIQKVNQTDQFGFMNAMNPLINAGLANAQQKKDFRVLEHHLVDMCTKQCLKKERNFHKDSELC